VEVGRLGERKGGNEWIHTKLEIGNMNISTVGFKSNCNLWRRKRVLESGMSFLPG